MPAIHAHRIDEHAVAAAEILDERGPAADGQASVLAAHEVRDDLQIAVGSAPDRNGLLRQGKSFRRVARQADQGGSLRVLGILQRRATHGARFDRRQRKITGAAPLDAAGALLQLFVQRCDSRIASFECSVFVYDRSLQTGHVSAAVVELAAERGDLARRAVQLLLAVAKLDDLRGDLLPFVFDLGFELSDGFDGW